MSGMHLEWNKTLSTIKKYDVHGGRARRDEYNTSLYSNRDPDWVIIQNESINIEVIMLGVLRAEISLVYQGGTRAPIWGP